LRIFVTLVFAVQRGRRRRGVVVLLGRRVVCVVILDHRVVLVVVLGRRVVRVVLLVVRAASGPPAEACEDRVFFLRVVVRAVGAAGVRAGVLACAGGRRVVAPRNFGRSRLIRRSVHARRRARDSAQFRDAAAVPAVAAVWKLFGRVIVGSTALFEPRFWTRAASPPAAKLRLVPDASHILLCACHERDRAAANRRMNERLK